MEKNKHILLEKYKELNRPVSQYELKYLQKNYRFGLNLSNLHITHADCKHTYLCRRFGKKFKELQEDDSNRDIGNCSVCWKISHTEFILKQIAKDFADEYYHITTNNTPDTYYKIQLEKNFHSWLYK